MSVNINIFIQDKHRLKWIDYLWIVLHSNNLFNAVHSAMTKSRNQDVECIFNVEMSTYKVCYYLFHNKIYVGFSSMVPRPRKDLHTLLCCKMRPPVPRIK